jgi:acyl carrier protein
VASRFFAIFDTRKRADEATFKGRPSYSHEQFWYQFFNETEVPPRVAKGVREVLEEVLCVNLSRFTDQDDFSNNLRFFFYFDSMADVEIVIELEKTFGIEIEDQEASETSTINEIVILVWRKLQVSDSR